MNELEVGEYEMNDSQTIVDLEHLNRQTLGDEGLIREILQIFADQIDLRMDSLAQDAPDLSEQAHSIKGSAKGIGAWELAAAAERVETGPMNTEEALRSLRMAMIAARHEVRLILRT